MVRGAGADPALRPLRRALPRPRGDGRTAGGAVRRVVGVVVPVRGAVWARADAHDPRRVLAASAICKATAFACWTCGHRCPGSWPGSCLWVSSSAPVSGTFEAYAYASLDSLGHANRYPAFIGRAARGHPVGRARRHRHRWSTVRDRRLPLVGIVSTLVCVVTIPLALRLPPPPAGEHSPERAAARLHRCVADRADRGPSPSGGSASAGRHVARVGLTACRRVLPARRSPSHGAAHRTADRRPPPPPPSVAAVASRHPQ